MAIIKHIASKNADYGEALKYLLFQHDEISGKPILDEQGRMMLRKEFYIDGINCEPMSFDLECEELNSSYHKNQRFNDIKTHQYVISFDPVDVEEHGLTGEKVQALCLEFAKRYFPGHQTLVVTHTDGYNQSGNLHCHIILNSLRKLDVEKQGFMERDCDSKAGYKHHLTRRYLRFLKQSVMEMCEREGLHQVDLLSPSPSRVTQKEYWIKRHGQKELDEINQEIVAEGLKPASTVFQTQKQKIRDAVDDISQTATDFESFRAMLFEKYKITVREKRGRLSYHLPEREKNITERALGTQYGINYLSGRFGQNRAAEKAAAKDYLDDPLAIFYYPSRLRLVVDLQTCVKAQQSRAYAQRVKISNLQKMAETLIYLQEHGYESREQLTGILAQTQEELEEARASFDSACEDLRDINQQLHYTGQYLSSKPVYQQMLHSRQKGFFRKRHEQEISAYEEARKYLKGKNPNGRFPSMKQLKDRKSELLQLRDGYNEKIGTLRSRQKDLEIVFTNTDAILDGRIFDREKKREEPSL